LPLPDVQPGDPRRVRVDNNRVFEIRGDPPDLVVWVHYIGPRETERLLGPIPPAAWSLMCELDRKAGVP
jgi:hypothetical protein